MTTKKDRVDREGVDTFLLIAAFILGVGLAVGLKWLAFPVWVPALAAAAVIVGYAVITYNSSSARLEPEQIGDNCYYLGFCITLASLAWTLYGLGSASGDAALINGVISGFGVALSSTIVGVMARVILLQFRVDLAAREKEARNTLNQVMREFFGEMQAAVASTTEMRTQIRQSLEEHTEQIIAQNVRMQDSFEGRLKNLVEDVGSGVQGAMNEVVEHGKEMNRRIAASTRSNMTSAETAIINSMEAVVADLKRVAGAFENGMDEANKQSVKALERIVSEVSAAIRFLSEETQRTLQKAHATQASQSTQAIEAVSSSIFELAGEMGRQKDKVGEAISEYTQETAKAYGAMSRLSGDSAKIHEAARASLESLAEAARIIAESAVGIRKAASEIAAVNPAARRPVIPVVAPPINPGVESTAGAERPVGTTSEAAVPRPRTDPASLIGNAAFSDSPSAPTGRDAPKPTRSLSATSQPAGTEAQSAPATTRNGFFGWLGGRTRDQ